MQNDDEDIVDDTKAEVLIDDEEMAEENGLNDKLKKLREELKATQAEKADYLAGWQRSKADFINARRDEEKSRGEFAKYAAEKILREILQVADSLQLSGSKECKLIYDQLMQILKKEGIVPVEAKGIIFNPMYHEALGQIETKNKNEDDMVLEELQKGYMLHDKVLRPSKVRVGVYKE